MPLPAALDSLPGGFEFRWSQFKWAVKSRSRRARGHHGAFKHDEVSARAAKLTDLWERTWPGAEPLGYVLRAAYADRWVQFHSLPGSKRYAASPAEYDEVLCRHRTVLHELHGSNYFWSASDLAGQQLDTLLLAVADDQCRVIIGAPDLAWLYCPYDGGADVLLPTVVDRDTLEERHSDWLSSHPRGL